ncbi:sugar phosphate isomerase/epimerase family protein [Georgenia daeguensis]|uniref:sugar phosphate isomerase/epimerase family protein n=1 Tax=Georgenia daeguensis TaxID=908355 RepID=UPI0031EDE1EC
MNAPRGVRLAYTVMSPEADERQEFAYDGPFAEAIRRLADIGYDGVELQVASPAKLDAERLVRELSGVGLAVAALATGPLAAGGASMCEVEPAAREAVLGQLRTLVDRAAVLGTRVSLGRILDNAPDRTVDPRDRMEQTARMLRELADYGDERGVRLLVEPQNRASTDLVNTIDDARTLIAATGRANIGVIGDTYHLALTEGSAVEAFESAGPLLEHVQFGDTGRGSPGTGDMPFPDVVAVLDRLGYRGWITLEHAQDRGDRTAELSYQFVSSLSLVGQGER